MSPLSSFTPKALSFSIRISATRAPRRSFAPAFSADCIETLEEINEEIKESFEEAGGESFTYIPCLNDDDAHIRALSDVIDQNLTGWV